MTALTDNKSRPDVLGDIVDLPVAASTNIYDGSAVGDNGSGYMRQLVSGDPFRGFAFRETDNSSGSAGDKNANIRRKGSIRLPISGVAVGDIGKLVYASDDNAFNITGAGTKIGLVRRYDASGFAIVEYDAGESATEEVLQFPINLADISDADVITAFPLTFSGRIKSVDFLVGTPVTTAAKLSTLNLEIDTTDVTGGVVALTSANSTPLGAVVNGTAITATNAFVNGDTLSVEATSTTAFVEGSGTLLITIEK